MSNPSDYTVGWVCALECEYVAAQEFLDEEHDPPDSLQPNDSNDYTLGRIGKHKVVIAVLPDGEYGTATAASVATSMLHSFPSVRIGLMVGIGGGAPSPTNDIRLGDIVVSVPCQANGVMYGGVFEYEFGTTIQGQAFQETRFLNQPPTTLRTAVRGLKTRYTRKGHQLGQAVDDVLNKNPLLQDEYSRPHPSTDVLFRSDFTHDSRGCAEFCAKDPSKQVPRHPRTVYHEKPAIHHGIIASANQLMKNAITRDRLAKERDVLCFEMEAAGLMNHFPCLVIRGTCDYSDSHKSKEWQGYAAMVAAAYAKDLLARIIPSRIENEQRISEQLSTAIHIIEKTEETVDVMKSRSDRTKELEMLNWLTAIDYGPQQSDVFKRHQPGTGQWLLDSDEYHSWSTTKGMTLFCPGIPGAGKTIAASVVINHLTEKLRQDPNSGLAYIYCDFRRRNEQTVEHFVSSLLKQLAEQQPTLPDDVHQLYKRHEKSRTKPSLEELIKSVHAVTKLFSHVFIVVDALDECQETDNCLPRFLSKLFSLQQELGVNIIATARPLGRIKSMFETAISIEIRAHDEDVINYLESKMGELPTVVQESSKLQEAIMDTLSQAVNGMFLLAKLHFESLVGKMTAKAIQTALESLPTGSDAIDGAYGEAMNRIQDQNRDRRDVAISALLWITYAKQPLTKPELQEALAVELGEKRLHQDNLPNIEDVASVCAGLIAIDQESDVVRLVHYTAQDFLERTKQKWFGGAEYHMTEICLTYLLFDQFRMGMKPSQNFDEIPLYIYAARNWGYHARDASAQKHPQVLAFLESGGPVQTSTRAFAPSIPPAYPGGRVFKLYSTPDTTGLHLAAWLGLEETVEALLQRGHDPNLVSRNVYDDGPFTPLFSATQRGHEKAVKILLSSQASPDCADHENRTALWWAAFRGDHRIVKLLMEKGADPDHRDMYGTTVLGVACELGHLSAVETLLEGAQIDLESANGHNLPPQPLLIAVAEGHVGVVETLLLKGAAAGLEQDWIQTALSLAARKGHSNVAQLLLRMGAIPYNSSTPHVRMDGHDGAPRALQEH